MILRRLFALLTSVTMFHLSVVAGDAACAAHGAAGHDMNAAAMHGTPAAASMSDDAMPMEASPTAERGAVKSGAPPCEVPAQQHCCEALVGCSVASAVTSAVQSLAPAISPAARIPAAVNDAPASFASAPEPPPPKA